MRHTYDACGPMKAAFAVAVGRAPRRTHRGDSSLGRPPAAVAVVGPASLACLPLPSLLPLLLLLLRLPPFLPEPGAIVRFRWHAQLGEKIALSVGGQLAFVAPKYRRMARSTLSAESVSMSVDASRVGGKDLMVGTIAARDVHGPHPREDLLGAAAGRFQRISEPEIGACQISRAEKL